jgi:hypothetical protein
MACRHSAINGLKSTGTNKTWFANLPTSGLSPAAFDKLRVTMCYGRRISPKNRLYS